MAMVDFDGKLEAVCALVSCCEGGSGCLTGTSFRAFHGGSLVLTIILNDSQLCV